MISIARRKRPTRPQIRNLTIAFVFGFGLYWLAIMIVAVLNIWIGIYFGIKASRGEWAAHPRIGRWARSIVGV